MRNWVLKALAAVCASAPLLVLLMLSLVMVGKEASVSRKDHAPAGGTGPTAAADSSLPGALTRWLEQAASTYQSDVAKKLSVPRQAGLVVGVSPSHATTTAGFDRLSAAVDAALRYITFWMEQAYRVAGYTPSNLAYSSVALLADQTARDARAFVEARKKAEADWSEAVERANEAAAEAARQEAARKSAAEKDAAEAERRRAEARKEELRRIKEDLDRRIEEGLKKLEELEKLDPTRKTEATRKALVADVARGASESLKAVAEARRASAERKAAAEKQAADAKAAYAREVTAAEQARKVAEAERARSEQERKAEEAARKAAEEKRLAEQKAEEARRMAAIEAVPKASETRKADETPAIAEDSRLAEAKADYARRVAAAEAARKTAEAEAALKAEEERQAADAAKAAREAELRQAEIKAIEERRQAAADTEEARKAEEARRAAESKRLEAKSSAEPTQTQEKTSETAQHQNKEARLAAATQGAPPSEAAPQRKQLRASRPSVKAHVVKSRRSAAKARYKRKKLVRARHARVHVVKRGETLWDISCRYFGDGKRYRTIYRANRGKIRNPHRIWPGQRLRLS